MKKWISLILVLQFLTLNAAFAQKEDDTIKNTQNDIYLVAGAGAAGAILGLSTLSFYDKPSGHLSNIWTGAAIGIIGGVIFVAYNSAQKGQEDLESYHSTEEFRTHERLAWHHQNSTNLTLPSVQFGTQLWQTSF